MSAASRKKTLLLSRDEYVSVSAVMGNRLAKLFVNSQSFPGALARMLRNEGTKAFVAGVIGELRTVSDRCRRCVW